MSEDRSKYLDYTDVRAYILLNATYRELQNMKGDTARHICASLHAHMQQLEQGMRQNER